MKYRRKPEIIDAIPFHASDPPKEAYLINNHYHMHTSTCTVGLSEGDMIITTSIGKRVMTRRAFDSLYELIEPITIERTPSGVKLDLAKELEYARIEITHFKAKAEFDMPAIMQGQYHNACTDACDMIDGPCACGAWHNVKEWIEKLAYRHLSILRQTQQSKTSTKDKNNDYRDIPNRSSHGRLT